jgi:hypothetical protein
MSIHPSEDRRERAAPLWFLEQLGSSKYNSTPKFILKTIWAAIIVLPDVLFSGTVRPRG